MSSSHNIHEVFVAQKAKSLILRSQPLHLREERLKSLLNWIINHREEIKSATFADFKKSGSETEQSETYVVISEIRHTLKMLGKWAKPVKVKMPLTFWGTKAEITYEPKGACLIIAPWNYPFSLCFGPLISCLAAGNTAILKPSELTPHTAALISKLVKELFEPSEVACFEGDREVAEELLALPFDHIFFTGSPAVGKQVMFAAAKNLTSVTLELGGKSPTIIDKSANLKDAAEKIAWGKSFNNGQTCIAPDYLLIHEEVEEKFVVYLKSAFLKLYKKSGEALMQNPDYARIVNAKNFQRLKGLIDDALQSGAKISFGGYANEDERFIEPTLLKLASNSGSIMEDEIFGPVLPYLTFNELDEVINIINSKPKPLSTYIFCKDDYTAQRLSKETSGGALFINGLLLQFAINELPFGGVNNSGIGKTHGHAGFLSFSNEKPILRQRIGFSSIKLLFPPYTNGVKKIQNLLIKYF